jgi:nucleoside 2-deoxyribosyltransferase
MLQTVFEPSTRDTYRVNCRKCGKYEIATQALTTFMDSVEKTKTQSVSYWLKHHQLPNNKFVYIDSGVLSKLLVPFVEPKPNEQAYNLIVWMGENVKKPSGFLDLQWEEAETIIGTTGDAGVMYVVDHLASSGYLTYNRYLNPPLEIGLTYEGWNYFYELQNSNKNSRLAFMAMKFGKERLNTIYNDTIKTAVADTGFEIRKLDENKKAGSIDDKLRVEIRRSKFLIADLTDGNNGAYWEAGFAEGLGLPVIYICEKKAFENKETAPHFDTNHHLIVMWEDSPDGLKQFSQELVMVHQKVE